MPRAATHERLDPLVAALFLAVEAWPVFLLAALAAGLLSLVLRGAARAFALAAAALIALPALGVGALAAAEAWSDRRSRVEHARTHTTLAAPATVDGVALPAGAEVQWEDASRRRVAGVTLRQSAEVLGVPASFLNRQGEDNWLVGMEEPRTIDGWPCAAPHVWLTGVWLTGAGRLRACTLSRATAWKGWDMPARTEVTFYPSERVMALTVPEATPLAAPGVGRLPWYVTLNDDGSLAMARYPAEAPLLVAGKRLWDDVEWRYDPATYGMGRGRSPVAVSGLDAAVNGEDDRTAPRAGQVGNTEAWCRSCTPGSPVPVAPDWTWPVQTP